MPHMLPSTYRLYEIRPSPQDSYTIDSGTTMQENQPALYEYHSVQPGMKVVTGTCKLLTAVDSAVVVRM